MLSLCFVSFKVKDIIALYIEIQKSKQGENVYFYF